MRYVITAPPYTQKSAGIKVLYELQKWLVRYGKDAMILNFSSPYQVADDDIVVYPEIVSGNPLGAKRVVRYILNHPGRLGGDKEYDKSEILVAYDGVLAQYSNGVILRTPCIEEFFTNRGYERTIDCFFVGKEKNTHHPVTKGCIEITYQWPAKRRELADLLNRTRYFYTYDQRTALISEAAKCGCRVKDIIGEEVSDNQIEEYDQELFKRQLEQFIQMTWYPEIDSNREASEAIDAALLQKKTQAHLEEGLLLKQKQRFTEALEAFAAAKEMGDTSALVHMGGCLANLGRLNEAEDAYTKALGDNGDNIEANTGIGVVKLLAKDFGAAITAFSKVLQSDPTNSKALCGLGMARLGEGRPRVGISYLKKALDADPENITALNELIKAAYDHEIFTEAIPCTRVYLMYHPGNPDILFSFAGLLYKTGAYAEARDEAERLLALSPEYQGGKDLLAKILKASAGNTSPQLTNNNNIYSKNSFDNIIQLGKSKKTEGMYEEALQLFIKARMLGNTAVLADMGDCNARLGGLDEARELYRERLQVDPEDVDALIGIGIIGLVQGKYAVAITFFNKALMPDSNNTKALCGLGMVKCIQGKNKEAIDYFSRALDSDPENLTALFELVKCAYGLELFDEAERHLRNYLRYRPADMKILFSLAGVLIKMEKRNEAQQKLETILLFDPEFEGAWEMQQMIGKKLPIAV